MLSSRAGRGRPLPDYVLRRAAVLLPLLTLLGGALLALSVLVEETGEQALVELLPYPGQMAIRAEAPAVETGADLPAVPETQSLSAADGAAPAFPSELSAARPATTTLVAPPVGAPVSVENPPAMAGDLNILLLGSDRRQRYGAGWRTDAIILVAVRPHERRVALFSLPRDLWVEIPGHGPGRINTVDYAGEREGGKGGGPRLLAATLQHNLDISVQHYVRIDFVGLERVVDALGGIDVISNEDYNELMDGAQPGLWRLRVVPGANHMDGRTALGYARSRLGSSDLDRGRRQQQVLLALRDAALHPANLPRLPGLITSLADAVETDLRLPQVLSLLQLACQLDASCYRSRTMDRTMVRDWVTPQGAMVLLPNHARIEQAWVELTQGP
ncbi:MAG: LCP family protein [Anaerolineae bacterium]